MKRSACLVELARREDQEEGTTTHKCAQVATLIHIIRSGENLTIDVNKHASRG
jgi:hypothetical protein